MLCFLNTGHVIYNTLQCLGKCFFLISSYLRAYLRINRRWVKFPWDLYNLGKQNIQVKEVQYINLTFCPQCGIHPGWREEHLM